MARAEFTNPDRKPDIRFERWPIFNTTGLEPGHLPGIELDRPRINTVLQSKHYGTRTRVGHLAHASFTSFAKGTGDVAWVPTPDTLTRNYYASAAHLYQHRADGDIASMVEVLEEDLAPYYDGSPIRTADTTARIYSFYDEPRMAAMTARLWTADHLGLEVPDAFTELRARIQQRDANQIGRTAARGYPGSGF